MANPIPSFSGSAASPQHRSRGKAPRVILEGIFAFAPNRETLGGTAYFLQRDGGNVLIDCPAWEPHHLAFLQERGGVEKLLITHRGGLGKQVKAMVAELGCEVIVQQEEAYLLPNQTVTRFEEELTLGDDLTLLWTPGFSPGSSCVYSSLHGGCLFSGRHLLVNKQSEILPLRTSKTFQWWWQLEQVKKISDRFSAETLNYLLPGANTGFLRGRGYVDGAFEKIAQLDLDALRSQPIPF